MIAKTKGIVLKCVKFRDNKSIAHILTEDFGKISYLVYAPQSKNAKIRQYNLQPLSRLLLDVEHNPHRELQQIKEAKPEYLNNSIISDPAKMSLCFFIAEVVDKTIYAIEKDETLFNFVYDYIDRLEAEVNISNMFPLSFIMDYAVVLGIYPYDKLENDYIKTNLNYEEQNLITELLNNTNTLDKTKRRKALHIMIEYFKHHFSGMGTIVSLDVLEALADNQ